MHIAARGMNALVRVLVACSMGCSLIVDVP